MKQPYWKLGPFSYASPVVYLAPTFSFVGPALAIALVLFGLSLEIQEAAEVALIDAKAQEGVDFAGRKKIQTSFC